MQLSAPDRKPAPSSPRRMPSVDEQQPVSPASPDSADASSESMDPLIAKAAKRIADVINDFKRAVEARDGTLSRARGSVEFTLQSDEFPETVEVIITSDEDVDKSSTTVEATLAKSEVITIDDDDNTTAAAPSAFKPTRCPSDAELEKDIVSRKKRKLDNGNDERSKRPRTGSEENEEDMPMFTTENLEHHLVKLREDIQEDTSDTVNHVQRLLRRFKDEWHEQTRHEFEHSLARSSVQPLRNSTSAADAGAGASFPSPDADRNDTNAPIAEIICRETGLLSRQIEWVESCRRVASDAHTKREETWRTSSAGFHDQQRQDRENFQNRMVHESAMHSQTLNQILNEVKAIGLYAQNMKWETPSYLNSASNATPQIRTQPVFPTQSPTPAFPPQPTRMSMSGPKHGQFTWKTGRGPGTHNG